MVQAARILRFETLLFDMLSFRRVTVGAILFSFGLTKSEGRAQKAKLEGKDEARKRGRERELERCEERRGVGAHRKALNCKFFLGTSCTHRLYHHCVRDSLLTKEGSRGT